MCFVPYSFESRSLSLRPNLSAEYVQTWNSKFNARYPLDRFIVWECSIRAEEPKLWKVS
jgi:hypothetical protein